MRPGVAERISARVQEIVGRAAERAEVSLERVLRELKAIAFSDIGKAVTWGPSVQVRDEEEDGQRVKVIGCIARAKPVGVAAPGGSAAGADAVSSTLACENTRRALIVCDFKEMDRLPMASASARFRTIQMCPKDLVRDWRHSRPQGR
jgi:hypothetical protein